MFVLKFFAGVGLALGATYHMVAYKAEEFYHSAKLEYKQWKDAR